METLGNLKGLLRVVTQILPNAGLMRPEFALEDNVSRHLVDRVLAAIQPLRDVKSPRHLRRVLNEIVQIAVPLNILVNARFLEVNKANTEHTESPSQFLTDAIGEIWAGLGQQSGITFSPSDRRIILDFLKMQAELAELAGQTPEENQPALYDAVADAFWSLQKIILCFFAVGAILLKALEPHDGRVLHWLCLAMKQYIMEWRSALFANDPILQERLSRPLNTLSTISSDEMRKRLGLQS